MDLLYSYIPKWVNRPRRYVVMTSWKHVGPENCDILRKICENSKFRYKSSEYQNFTGFLLICKRKMVIPTYSVSFSIIVCKYFSKWRINVFLKLKSLHQPPPAPSDFDGLPYPRVRWYPQFFFHENDCKGCKKITYMPLVTFFSILERPVKTRKGVAITPPWLDEG